MNEPEEIIELDNPIVDPRQEERLAWARGMMRIGPGVSGPALTGVLLARLVECELVPTPSWRESLSMLARPPWEASDLVSAAQYQDELNDEIEEFAGRFFSIPVVPRRVAWNELVERSKGMPKLRERLHQLSGGLLIDAGAIVCEGQVREIVDAILRLFVLPPMEQAELRRRKLAQWAESKPHQAAARVVREQHSKIAGLTPLIDPVADAEERARERARIVQKRYQENKRPAAPANRFAWGWASLPVVCIMASFLLRGVQSISSVEKNRSPVPDIQSKLRDQQLSEDLRREMERFKQQSDNVWRQDELMRRRERSWAETKEALQRSKKRADEYRIEEDLRKSRDEAIRRQIEDMYRTPPRPSRPGSP